ncbi:MAG: NifB/NifX family molybdenum-iron cluster-binding protein [Nitrososphaeria archaeon]
MWFGKLRVVVPTKDNKGLEDEVSEMFGKAKTFTIIDIIDGKIEDVKIIENPAASYRFGAGPIVVKTLTEMETDAIVAGELGPGASALIKDQGMSKITVKPGTKVSEAIRIAEHQLANVRSNDSQEHGG